MADPSTGTPVESRIASAHRVIAAPAAVIFDVLADPSRHHAIDGNNNLAGPTTGSRVRAGSARCSPPT